MLVRIDGIVIMRNDDIVRRLWTCGGMFRCAVCVFCLFCALCAFGGVQADAVFFCLLEKCTYGYACAV